MSLINEALKKAQAQRQGGTPSQPPPPGMPPPGNPPPSAGPSPLWPIVLVFFGVALLFAGGAALIVWGMMRSSGDQPDQSVAVASAQVDVDSAEPVPPLPPPAPTGSDTEASPAEAIPGPVAPPSPSPVPAASPPAPTPTPTPTPTPRQDVAPPAPSPTAPPVRDATPPKRANPAVETFLARLEVRGVMAGGQRALLYNQDTQRTQAFESGAIISNELQLRVGEITMRSITFVDHDGFVYTKRF